MSIEEKKFQSEFTSSNSTVKEPKSSEGSGSVLNNVRKVSLEKPKWSRDVEKGSEERRHELDLVIVSQKAKPRFFTSFKKKRNKELKVKGFRKPVKKLVERDVYLDRVDEGRLWEKVLDKGRKLHRYKMVEQELYKMRMREVERKKRRPKSLGFKA